MAFLQRVVNGGGQINREMASGTGRLVLCIVDEGKKYPSELKLWRGEKSVEQGLAQTAGYIDTCGCTEGWLAVFDRRASAKWADKIYMRKERIGEITITIVGL
jgi:hypothetical protein